MAGVTIATGNGRTALTDGRGKYTLADLPAGAYTLTVARIGYGFSPASRQVTLPPHAADQDFTASPACTGDTTPVDVMLVIDRSARMAGQPLSDAIAAAGNFVDRLSLAQDQAGLVSFGDAASLNRTLTHDGAAVKAGLAGLAAGGGTHLSAGIAAAQTELTGPRHQPGARPALVLLVGSQPTMDTAADALAAAQAAKNAGIRLFTIALGSVDVNLVRKLASSPADFFYAPASSDLAAVYAALAGMVNCPQTKIVLQPASKRLPISAGAFTLDVVGQDVTNLAALQADLTFDPAIVRVTAVTVGPFLGSTGRTVSPVGPTIDNTTGRVTFGAFSVGAQGGASGTGVLATLTFEPRGAGVSAVQMLNLHGAIPDGSAVTLTGENGQVEVEGCYGDFDGNGAVDIAELQLLAAHWNCRVGDACYAPAFDAEPDGDIDIFDLQRFAAGWGRQCTPASSGRLAQNATSADGVDLRLLPPNTVIGIGERLVVTLELQSVTGIGAFETVIAFDPAVLEVEQVVMAPFLGSTGRSVTTMGPVLDAADGRISFGAFTFGSQAGASGTGDLAYIFLRARAAGQTDVSLQQTSVSSMMGDILFLNSVEGNSVTVGREVRVYLPMVVR